MIIALDHGLIDGPCPGFERPAETISAIVAGGPDAILTSYGIAQHFADELEGVAVILRSDGSVSNLNWDSTGSVGRFFGVEDALRVGADALAVTAFPGSPSEAATLHNLARTIGEAHSVDMPVMAEMVPGGFDAPVELRGTDAVAFAARLGSELGADLIKAPYCENFAQVTFSTFAPVVILGGSKGSEAATLSNIRAAVDNGAAGVAMGRNVFQSDNPTAMTRAVVAVVHADASVEEALSIWEG